MKLKQNFFTPFNLVVLTVLLIGLAVLAVCNIVFAGRDDFDQINNGQALTGRDAFDQSNNSKITTGRDAVVETKSDLKPELKIVSEKLEKESVVTGVVKEAKQVEYNLVKEGSVDPKIYLGKAEANNANEWSLDYNFSNLPNGNYELSAQVKNDYGTYSSGTTAVKVDNNANNSNQQATSAQSSSASEQLKETQRIQEEVRNNFLLSEEEKRQQIRAMDQEKERIKAEFISRQQAERLIARESTAPLTNEEKQAVQEIKQVLQVDSDADGLSDYEEERIGSDPFSADSDQDGYLDGDEVKNGHNPLKTSSEKGADKIVFQEPKSNGTESSFYRIDKVEIKKDETDPEKKGKVQISGKALPNSFITLYIYSDPIVVTVKTNEDGNWTYTLDKELEDGNHEVYSAVTDNTGKITSKSKVFSFVKTAQAISLPKQASRELELVRSPMQQQKTGIVIFVAVTSLLSMVTALASVALLFKSHKDNLEN